MKNLKLWYLYDFANSFASAVFIFYFPLVLAEQGYSDNYIGIATAISTFLLVLFFPFLGRKSDSLLKLRMKYIRVASLVMLVCLFVVAYLYSFRAFPSFLFVMLLCFILFQVAFQGSYVFYTAQMKELEDHGFNKDKLSSIGMGFGQLGNAVAVGIAGYLIAKNASFLGLSDKSLVFFFGGVAFFVFSLPYLLQKTTHTAVSAVQNSTTSIIGTIKSLSQSFQKSKKLLFFGFGYMLIADSVFTLQAYLSLYFKKVFLLSDSQISIVLATGLLLLVFTCIIVGNFARKIKSERKFLIISSIIYIASFIGLACAPNNFYYLLIALSFTSVAYGLFFPFARAYYSNLVPKENQAEFFSVFVIFERAASVLGPVLFVVTLSIFSLVNVEVGYRTAVWSLAVISIVGFFFMKKHSKYPEISK